jgi:hypothetical protein
MKSNKFGYGIFFLKAIPFLFVVCFTCSSAEAVKRVPIIYSSDLFNPPDDPDDHYDLATLFMVPELDVKAFIFDISSMGRKPKEAGIGSLMQISAITGRPMPPYAIGLRHPLVSPDDQAKEQEAEFQGGVDLVLKTLRESKEKVVLCLVGSCRDFAVAYNREPDLLRKKVSAVYISAGNGPSGKQREHNAGLDPNAYICLLESDLPIYWLPCMPRGEYKPATKEDILEKNDNTYNTFYVIHNQAEFLQNTTDRLRNFINYALTRSREDPMQYLERTPKEVTTSKRWMWSTAAFTHAAGWKFYADQDGGYRACSPQEAKKLGISNKEVKVFAFDPIRLSQAIDSSSQKLPVLQGDLNVKKSTTQIFHYIHPNYNEIMVSALSTILKYKKT